MNRIRVTRRTKRQKGLERVKDLEAKNERDKAVTDFILSRTLLTLIPLQPPHISLVRALTDTL